MRLVHFRGFRRRRFPVLELVLLRLWRRPEHGVVDRRDFDVLDDAAAPVFVPKSQPPCSVNESRGLLTHVAQAGRRSMRSPEGVVIEIWRRDHFFASAPPPQ